MTLGINIYTKQLRHGAAEENLITLSLYDIGGQDRFKHVRHTFLKGALGAAFVYDVTRPTTLDKLDEWWKQLRAAESRKNVVTVLVGNKVDLTDFVAVSEEEGRAFAEKIGSLAHIYTSAKTSQNVNEMFTRLADAIMNQNR